jgi:hypothetical protein
MTHPVALGAQVAQVFRVGPGRQRLAAAVARVDSHGVSGAPPVLVDLAHRRQLKPVRVLRGQRCANEARGVAHHEGHQFRRGEFGREDEIALVLTVLIVGDDDGFSRADVLDRFLDGVKPAHERPPSASLPVWSALLDRQAGILRSHPPEWLVLPASAPGGRSTWTGGQLLDIVDR